MDAQDQAGKEEAFHGRLFHALMELGGWFNGDIPTKIHVLPADFYLWAYSKC